MGFIVYATCSPTECQTRTSDTVVEVYPNIEDPGGWASLRSRWAEVEVSGRVGHSYRVWRKESHSQLWGHRMGERRGWA